MSKRQSSYESTLRRLPATTIKPIFAPVRMNKFDELQIAAQSLALDGSRRFHNRIVLNSCPDLSSVENRMQFSIS